MNECGREKMLMRFCMSLRSLSLSFSHCLSFTHTESPWLLGWLKFQTHTHTHTHTHTFMNTYIYTYVISGSTVDFVLQNEDGEMVDVTLTRRLRNKVSVSRPSLHTYRGRARERERERESESESEIARACVSERASEGERASERARARAVG